MKLLLSTILIMTCLSIGACGSHQDRTGGAEAGPDTTPAQECICGTREADLDGCPCGACASGEGNPDNPKCVCAPLTIDSEGGD